MVRRKAPERRVPGPFCFLNAKSRQRSKNFVMRKAKGNCAEMKRNCRVEKERPGTRQRKVKGSRTKGPLTRVARRKKERCRGENETRRAEASLGRRASKRGALERRLHREFGHWVEWITVWAQKGRIENKTEAAQSRCQYVPNRNKSRMTE